MLSENAQSSVRNCNLSGCFDIHSAAAKGHVSTICGVRILNVRDSLQGRVTLKTQVSRDAEEVEV